VACQVSPLTRLGQGAQALDAPADKFRDWQENTNSIFWAARKVAPANGSLVLLRKKKPRLRGQHTRPRNRKSLHPRSSEARRESFCPLDKDLSWKSRYRTGAFGPIFACSVVALINRNPGLGGLPTCGISTPFQQALKTNSSQAERPPMLSATTVAAAFPKRCTELR
jgi:hypothetical protein